MLNIRFGRTIGFEDSPARSFGICNRLLITNELFSELGAFQSEISLTGDNIHPADPPTLTPQPKLVYHGPGWLTDRMVEVRCDRYSSGYHLFLDGIGTFIINNFGETITQIEADPDCPARSIREAFLGPVLILALALQGTWCFHAGAIMSGSRTIIFMGESGLGKSTLASYLGGRVGTGWRLASDDILPVALGDRPEALPHFPQLKLPADGQPAATLPESLPLHSIYILSQPDDPTQKAVARLLSRRDGALALLRHTVAARLFDEQLLSDHLAFCAQVAENCPIYQLTYPHNQGSLARVREIVVANS